VLVINFDRAGSRKEQERDAVFALRRRWMRGGYRGSAGRRAKTFDSSEELEQRRPPVDSMPEGELVVEQRRAVQGATWYIEQSVGF